MPKEQLEQKKAQVKEQIKQFLVNKLKHHEISSQRVSEIAKQVLEVIKDVVSVDELELRLGELEEQINELHELREERFKEQNEQAEKAIATIIAKLIKQEEFDQALKYGKWSAETQEDQMILEELKKIYPTLD